MLKERFYNTYRLCGNNEEKLKLLSRKGVYPYEYMDSWEKFKLLAPLEKEYYYSELNDSNIDDGDIGHKKNLCNTFKISKLVNIFMYHLILLCLLMSLKSLEISV